MDIFKAIESNNLEELKKILLTVRVKDLEDGCLYDMSPLHHACFVGSLEVMELFLKKGIDVNDRTEGRYLLSSAVVRGDSDMVRLLLENGANVNAIDEYGRTALAYAVDKKFFEIEGMLRRFMRENK